MENYFTHDFYCEPGFRIRRCLNCGDFEPPVDEACDCRECPGREGSFVTGMLTAGLLTASSVFMILFLLLLFS